MNPKIIQPDMVEFAATEAPAAPQTLEQALSAAPAPAITEDWARENMRQLSDKITPLLQRLYTQPSSGSDMRDHNFNYGDEARLFPYSIKLQQEGGLPSYRRIVFGAAPSSFVRDLLVSTYGPEVAQCGIFEACGLDAETIADFNPLIKYVPELRPITHINGKLVKLVSNAYLSTLALPIEHRPFFAGALLRKEQACPGSTMFWGGFDANCLVKPLVLKDVLEYAKEVDQVPKVKEYMDLYAELA